MLLFLPAAFVCSLALGLNGLGLIFDLKVRFDLSPEGAGWINALWSATYLASGFLLRPLTRRLAPRISMLIACLSGASLLSSYLAFPSLAHAYFINALMGVAISFYWPPFMGWVSHGLEGQALATMNGRFSVAWSLGGIIAPYVAGLLAESRSWLPTAASAVLLVATALLLVSARRFAPDPVPASKSDVLPARSDIKGDKDVERAHDRSTGLRYPAWIGVFLVYMMSTVFNGIFPLFAKTDLGMSESKIGFLLLIKAAATSVGFAWFGRRVFWHFKRGLIVVPMLLLLAVDLAFIGARSAFTLGLFLAMLGILHAWAYGNSMFYGASGAPDRQRRMNIHESVLNAGQVLGSLGAGLAYQNLSWEAVFVAGALPILLGIALQLRLLSGMKAER